ncbi:hypothetical protein FE257_008110 [Aspergillus nanangensis]|uniref:Uncharacterized protein n=1 Tax=Aspergillus nanangensis TaxID=2582783 RepID=A0AAD4GTS7_ASPNN|nr:hypothetical protein FE257_008110 [Aspergillus nanangensis]
MESLSDLATSIFAQAESCRGNINTQTDVQFEDEQLMFSFKALFHQCQITLHLMIVPVFAGTSIGGAISPETVRNSAEMVINHAHSFKSLLSPYLYAKADITHVPPLVAFGAFITAMVLLTTEVSCQARCSQTAPPGRHNESGRLSAVEAILGLLDALRRHWKALQHPYEKLSAALKVTLSANQSHGKSGTMEHVTDARNTTRGFNRRSSAHAHPQLSDPGETIAGHLAHSPYRAGMSEDVPRPAAGDTSIDIDNVDDEFADNLFMAPSSELHDTGWYSLSFAEAGIEQFAGYEPLSLFQGGWRAFS